MTACGPISVFAPIRTLVLMTVYADFDAGVEFGFGVDDGGRVDEGHVLNTPLLVKTNNRKSQFVDFIADRNHLIAKMAKY